MNSHGMSLKKSYVLNRELEGAETQALCEQEQPVVIYGPAPRVLPGAHTLCSHLRTRSASPGEAG